MLFPPDLNFAVREKGVLKNRVLHLPDCAPTEEHTVLLPTKGSSAVAPGGHMMFLMILAPQQMQVMLLAMRELHRLPEVRGGTVRR